MPGETGVPEEYHGREHALIKHTVLKQYLMRLIMIVGQSRANTIGYVDAYAGPWKSDADDLSDTSIGIALEQMEKAHQGYRDRGWDLPEFKAVFVERDPERFAELEAYLERRAPSLPDNFRVKAFHGDFHELKPKVLGYFHPRDFVFFFVDPKGWKDVQPDRLEDLLERPNSELLINFMYDFVNRFQDHLRETVGPTLPENLDDLEPAEREREIVRAYRRELKRVAPRRSGKLRTGHVRIKDPVADRPKYQLVYVTSHFKGLVTFMEESEKAEKEEQPIIRAATKERRREERTGQMGLALGPPKEVEADFNRPAEEDLEEVWLERLETTPKHFDEEDLADLLEETDCFISDLQEALRSLIDSDRAENLDAKGHRPKNVVNFTNNEQLRLVEEDP